MSTIIVLDDDPVLVEELIAVLSRRDRRVQGFCDPIQGLAAISEERADLLITDLSMPWLDGKDVVTWVRQRHPELKILLMSGYARGAALAASESIGFLRKPVDLDALLNAIDEALGDIDPSEGALWT